MWCRSIWTRKSRGLSSNRWATNWTSSRRNRSGAWGFASTDRLTREGVAACAAQAVSIAKASALAKRSAVVLAPEKVHVDSWQSPFRKDPFEIPLETQLAL